MPRQPHSFGNCCLLVSKLTTHRSLDTFTRSSSNATRIFTNESFKNCDANDSTSTVQAICRQWRTPNW
jgi:hypothetical protein